VSGVICPYCEKPAKLVTGAQMYPYRPDLADLRFWDCRPCDAYVGCHKNGSGYGDGTRPLGRLANAELRDAKQMAHRFFDQLWKSGGMKRGSAYAWLADELRIPKQDCHIGMFDVQRCKDVVKAVQRRYAGIRAKGEQA
jgi:hypothetical protein